MDNSLVAYFWTTALIFHAKMNEMADNAGCSKGIAIDGAAH